MNIIKLKDVVWDGYPEWNEKWKGNWVGCSNYKYLFLLEDWTFINEEKFDTGDFPMGIDILDLNDQIKSKIDWVETQKYWDVENLKKLNTFIPKNKIELIDVQLFKIWLGISLKTHGNLSEVESAVCNYYANNEEDNVIRGMKLIVSPSDSNQFFAPCSKEFIKTENDISMYKRSMKNRMIETFSNIEFWKKNEFILNDLIARLDAIITYNLPFYSDTQCLDCCTLLSFNSEYNLINNTSKSFRHIKLGEESQHNLYILQNLKDFFTNLFELCLWV